MRPTHWGMLLALCWLAYMVGGTLAAIYREAQNGHRDIDDLLDAEEGWE